MDQSAVVSAEGQGAEVLLPCTKAEPDIRCTVHELVRCGTNPPLTAIPPMAALGNPINPKQEDLVSLQNTSSALANKKIDLSDIVPSSPRTSAL